MKRISESLDVRTRAGAEFAEKVKYLQSLYTKTTKSYIVLNNSLFDSVATYWMVTAPTLPLFYSLLALNSFLVRSTLVMTNDSRSFSRESHLTPFAMSGKRPLPLYFSASISFLLHTSHFTIYLFLPSFPL